MLSGSLRRSPVDEQKITGVVKKNLFMTAQKLKAGCISPVTFEPLNVGY